MDAPTYPPAGVYEAPRPAPIPFSVDNYSLAELMAYPAEETIVFREIPALQLALRSPQLHTHLSNFTLQSFSNFGIAPADAIARVNGLIRALPAGERPGQ